MSLLLGLTEEEWQEIRAEEEELHRRDEERAGIVRDLEDLASQIEGYGGCPIEEAKQKLRLLALKWL